MITRFYVKTQDHKCPLAHRYDAVPEGYVFRGESNYAQGDLWPFEKRDNRYLVTYIDGLEDPGSTLTDTEIANADGSKFIRSQISKRTLTIKVFFNPELNGPELIEARTDLANVFGSGKMVQLYLIDSYKPWNGADPIIKEVATIPEVGVAEEDNRPVIYKVTSGASRFYKWDGSKYYETFGSDNFRNVLGEIGWIATGRVETFEADIYAQDCAASISIVCNDPKLYYWAYNRITVNDILYDHKDYSNTIETPDFEVEGTRLKWWDGECWNRFDSDGAIVDDYEWGNDIKVLPNGTTEKCYNPYKTSRTSETKWSSFTPSTVEISTLRNHYDGAPVDPTVKYKEVIASPIEIGAYVRKSHGLEFHDNANIPLTIRFERGDNFPSSHRTDGSYSPSIEYAYYEVNENYVSEMGNTGEYYLYVNPGDVDIFDDTGDRLTIYNEGFCDTSEINACSKISNVDAAHIRNRDAEAYNKKMYIRQLKVEGTISSLDKGDIAFIEFYLNYGKVPGYVESLSSDDVKRYFHENDLNSKENSIVGKVKTSLDPSISAGTTVFIYLSNTVDGYSIEGTDVPSDTFMLFNSVPTAVTPISTEDDFEYDSAKKLLHNIPLTEDAWPMIPKGTLGSYTIRTILHGSQMYKNSDFIHSLKLTTARYNVTSGDTDETRHVHTETYLTFNEVNTSGQNLGNRGWASFEITDTTITNMTDAKLKEYFISKEAYDYGSVASTYQKGISVAWTKWKDEYPNISGAIRVFYNRTAKDAGHALGKLDADTYYMIQNNGGTYTVIRKYRAGGTNVPKWGYNVPSKYNIVKNINPINIGEIHFSINFQKGTSLTQENIAQYFIQNGITNSANAMDCTFHTWDDSIAPNQDATVFYDQAKERFTLDKMNYIDSATFRTYVPKSATVHDSITSTSLRDLPDDTFEKASVYMRPYRMSL